MRAEVISIGTELLLGAITDTNATFIALELGKIGLDLVFRTTVGDNQDRIASAIDIALSRVDIVITTGGLGPTVDDVTREAIAQATKMNLEFHQILLDQIAERFRHFGVTMTENNRRQAYAPVGARVIENPVGTAPIFMLETERGTIMTLPGVPREMQYLLEHELIPCIKTIIGAPSIIKSLTLRTVGIGESQIDARIADLMTLSNPTVGLAAHSGQTDIRVTAKAVLEAEADRMISQVETEIRLRVGDWIYGTGDQSIEDVVLDLLDRKASSLATIEWGTNDWLQRRIAEASKARPRVKLYSDSSSPPQGTLRDTATQAADSVRALRGTTYGLSAYMVQRTEIGNLETEIAVAVTTGDDARTRSYTWQAERTDAHIWITTTCLALLWRSLTNAPEQP